ncbi:hypothetical protein [Peredibacter starrii]|uniref:Secreted protein n=1 Tax=Peredibacter starrii TaxID=28202 RepID=A0AAX4HT58_9BACT|nr:hypothetical protein [Peredibacter starrii]WPU66114.1 hypothetical protein SOO65_05085 [Peredibacter starrii]
MKFISLSALLLFVACSKPEQTSEQEPSDDYVLIELASKLEEDYHRLHKIPYDTSAKGLEESAAEAPEEPAMHEPMDPHHP